MEKLEQGQVWKAGEDYYRIVTWQRLAIEYKHITDWVTREGTVHNVTKKEFCRLIRNAELLVPDEPESDVPESDVAESDE